MTRHFSVLLLTTLALVAPALLHAQVLADGVQQLHGVLDKVYDQMIGLSSQILDVCRAIAAFGASFYIGHRVWKHIARAESIDFFPLFRPFVMIILIGIYPSVLSTINAILKPSVTATAALVKHSNDAVQTLLVLQAKTVATGDTALQNVILPPGQAGGQDWQKYSQPPTADSGGFWSTVGSGLKFLASGFIGGLRFIFKFLLSIILELLYFAASLCIDGLRTFHLIVLAILGPFVLAFSCFDGFQNSLNHWLARYVNVYLWLPVANLFGAILGRIQENMLLIDLDRARSGSLTLFSATDLAYLIFLIIGIIGYLTVPSITNYIIHTHGPNPIGKMISDTAGRAAMMAATGGAGAVAGGTASAAGASASTGASTSASVGPVAPGASQYSRDKISG